MRADRPYLLAALGSLLAMSMLLPTPAAAAEEPDLAAYTALLQANVHWTPDGHGSVVDYGGLQRDQDALEAVLRSFSAVTPAAFAAWDRPRQMSFLINAYNAFTVKLILEKYPGLESIRDLGSLLRSPWKKRFFPLLGETRTLDWLEHEQLRARYRDARVHFAVNCASVGCPALRPEAFVAERLDDQLDDQQRRFLGDRSRNRFDAAGGVLSVSPIFKWFAEDFHEGAGGVEAWMAARADLLGDGEPARARLRRGDFRLAYLAYDWSLNAQDRAPRR